MTTRGSSRDQAPLSITLTIHLHCRSQATHQFSSIVIPGTHWRHLSYSVFLLFECRFGKITFNIFLNGLFRVFAIRAIVGVQGDSRVVLGLV